MKKERGSITIITLTTVLFMMAFLLSTYTIISNRRQAQVEIKKETAKIYEEDVERVDIIYDGYFANADEEIPIYTAEQLFKIATDKTVAIDGRLYKFSKESRYVLMNNITFDVEEYGTWTNYLENKEGFNLGNFNYNNRIIVEQGEGFNTTYK